METLGVVQPRLVAGEQTNETMTPPYVPWKTLWNFIESLREQRIPQRIDRSAMGKLSGAYQSQVTVALRYLGLIDGYGNPQDNLYQWVETTGEQRTLVLRRILTDAYGFLLGDGADGFDISRASKKQFEEKFAQTGAKGDTLRKAQAFFINAAQAAGIPLSPYIMAARSSETTARPRTTTKAAKKTVSRRVAAPVEAVDNEYSPAQPQVHYPTNPQQKQGTQDSMLQMLVAKYPNFDPNWEKEIQKDWFSGFQRMMDIVREQHENGEEAESR